MCVLQITVSKYLRQKLIELKGEKDKLTAILGDFMAPLSVINKQIDQKIGREIADLNNTLNHVGFIDIYKTKCKSRIHVIFMYTHHLHKDRSYARP